MKRSGLLTLVVGLVLTIGCEQKKHEPVRQPSGNPPAGHVPREGEKPLEHSRPPLEPNTGEKTAPRP